MLGRSGEAPSRSSGPGLTAAGPGVAPGAGPLPRHGLANPVVVILLLAGFFDGISGNPVGGLLLATVGLGLACSRAGEVGEGTLSTAGAESWVRRRPFAGPAWLVGLALAGYAILAGAPSRFSWPATLAVAVPGAAIVLLARHPAPRRRPLLAPSPIGAGAWAAVLVCLGVWELINLLLQPSFTTGSWDHPTLSTLADPVFASHAGRSAGLAAWLGAGWYLVER